MEIKNPDQKEQVELSWEINMELPYVDKDGTLAFQEEQVSCEVPLKVLLPAEVVKDKKTLTAYLREQHEMNGDLPSYGQINIWDENKNIKEGGTFRFGWNYDGSKCLPDEKITADL